jgi:hypothetical protein
MTDNTMAKRKRTKGQTTSYKTLHRKLKIERHEPHKKAGVNFGAFVCFDRLTTVFV